MYSGLHADPKLHLRIDSLMSLVNFGHSQARKREQVLANSAPSDPHNDAKLEREKREEESVIHETCLELGVRIHEVKTTIPVTPFKDSEKAQLSLL